MKPFFENIGIAVLRVTAGLSMSTHGYGKIFGGRMESFSEGVAGMGFPAPEVFAWAAALSELVGGVCLAVGLGTRMSALLIAATMVVAIFVRHASDPFAKKELGLLYLAIMVYFLFAGGGKWAVDAMLGRRKKQSQSG